MTQSLKETQSPDANDEQSSGVGRGRLVQSAASERRGGELESAGERKRGFGDLLKKTFKASVEQPAPPAAVDPGSGQGTAAAIDPNADIWKAVVLFTFAGNNEDEINITENEQVGKSLRAAGLVLVPRWISW